MKSNIYPHPQKKWTPGNPKIALWKGQIVWSKQSNHHFWGSNIHIFTAPNCQPNSYSLNIATEMVRFFGGNIFPSEPATFIF